MTMIFTYSVFAYINCCLFKISTREFNLSVNSRFNYAQCLDEGYHKLNYNEF